MSTINGIDSAPYVAAHRAGIEAFDAVNDMITARDVALDFDNRISNAASSARRKAAATLDVQGAIAEFHAVLIAARAEG